MMRKTTPKTLRLARFLFIWSFFVFWGAGRNWGQMQEKPRPSSQNWAPQIEVEWMEILDECPQKKICVQGLIKNTGGNRASRVYLKIPIGGTQYISPRKILYATVDQPRMAPGDSQEFYVEIPRTVQIKSNGGRRKMAVGKYNFGIVPMWDGKR